MITEQRKGETLILSQAFIWGLFPIITILTYAKLPGLVSLGWSTAIDAVFFAIVLTYRKNWHELKNPQLWKYALIIAFFLGFIFYGLFYSGLTKTTAGNGGIIVLFEIFTSFLFFHVLRKDHISFEHIIGAVCMVAGAVIILAPNFTHFNIGDILIFVATFSTPIGNWTQQRARRIASPESILFLRGLLATPLIFILAAFLGQYAPLADVRASLLFLIINGVVLFGVTKIMWLEAIHRISVTKAMSLGSISALFTLIFGWLFLHQNPTIWQFLSLAPMLLGIFLLTDQLKLSKRIA